MRSAARARDALTLTQIRDVAAAFDDDADPFMTGDERQRRFHGPVAVRRVEIGMADAAFDDLHEHFVRPGCCARNFVDRQGVTELTNECGFHGFHKLVASEETLV